MSETETIEPSQENVADDVLVAFHKLLADAEAKCEKAAAAKKAADKAKTQLRQEIKGATGLKLENFDKIRADMLKDPDEVKEDLREQARISRAMNYKLGSQLTLFERMDDIEQEKEAYWFAQGYQAGLAGDWREDCPHDEGSDGRPHWLKGWDEQQKVLLAGMAKLRPDEPEEGNPEAEGGDGVDGEAYVDDADGEGEEE